jgi:hypothetical protein
VTRYTRKPVEYEDFEAIQWTGLNLAEVQAFVGRNQNMDGDVDSPRFFEPEARDEEGERIWNVGLAHLWEEDYKRWQPVQVGDYILKGGGKLYGARFTRMAEVPFVNQFQPIQ